MLFWLLSFLLLFCRVVVAAVVVVDVVIVVSVVVAVIVDVVAPCSLHWSFELPSALTLRLYLAMVNHFIVSHLLLFMITVAGLVVK